MTTRKATLTALAAVLGLALAANAQEHKALGQKDATTDSTGETPLAGRHVRYTAGDVFVSVGLGQVIEFTPSWRDGSNTRRHHR